MKVSELTSAEVTAFLHLDGIEPEISPDALLSAARAFVRSYTRMTDEEIDEHDDISAAVLVLCSDMYDNRQLTVASDKVNNVVTSILNMHQRTLVG